MKNVTTIQLNKSAIGELKKLKKYPRQTYNELIMSLIKNARKQRRLSQYDEFLHRIQQAKMKELWDNDADAVWDNA